MTKRLRIKWRKKGLRTEEWECSLLPSQAGLTFTFWGLKHPQKFANFNLKLCTGCASIYYGQRKFQRWSKVGRRNNTAVCPSILMPVCPSLSVLSLCFSPLFVIVQTAMISIEEELINFPMWSSIKGSFSLGKEELLSFLWSRLKGRKTKWQWRTDWYLSPKV